MKVLEGGNIPSLVTPKMAELKMMENEKSNDTEVSDLSEAAKPFIRFMEKAVLKKDPKKESKQRYEKPTLDISLPHVCLLSVQASQSLITDKISHSSPFHLYYRSLSIAI